MGEFVCGRIPRNSSGMGVSSSEGNGILHTDESGAEYQQYVEDVSKSNNGGLAHLRIKNKVVRAYENVEKPERCPCLLYTSPSPRDLSTSRMPSSA